MLLAQQCYPTPHEFVECLVPEGNFFLSNVDSDWGVNLEESFVFSVLTIVSLPSSRSHTSISTRLIWTQSSLTMQLFQGLQ